MGGGDAGEGYENIGAKEPDIVQEEPDGGIENKSDNSHDTADDLGYDDWENLEPNSSLSEEKRQELKNADPEDRPEPQISLNPETGYLDDEYIKEWSSKFDDGAIRVTTWDSLYGHATIDGVGSNVSSWDTKVNGASHLGPDMGFVAASEDFCKAYRESNGSLGYMEAAMGFDKGSLNREDIVFAVIDREDLHDLKVPRGDEIGVNRHWEPGGYTSGGLPEGVVNFSKVEKAEVFAAADFADYVEKKK